MGYGSGAQTLVIAEQFRGPPQSGNGGYVAGLLAGVLAPDAGQAVEVTLRSPVPLEQPLGVEREGARVRLVHADKVIAEAQFAALELAIPEPASWERACAARDEP